MTNSKKSCRLIGLPMQCGTHVRGCLMGPDSFRTAGLAQALEELGHDVRDMGNIAPASISAITHQNPAIHDLDQTIAWMQAIEPIAYAAAITQDIPIFLGGDHALSLGTIPGITRAAAEKGQTQFVLWLDAHTDFHNLDTTTSGNLHGTPVAYFSGRTGFDDYYPPLVTPVPEENILMMGIRSIDPGERMGIKDTGIEVFDMRKLDETGVGKPLNAFLERVAKSRGALHISLDVDFLDPTIAPGVGTTVPGGATFREAHLIMEMVSDSGLMTSLDLVELNPYLDERGKTAALMVDLCASLFGRQVFDRHTKSYA